jgi:putative flippase GtrA
MSVAFKGVSSSQTRLNPTFFRRAYYLPEEKVHCLFSRLQPRCTAANRVKVWGWLAICMTPRSKRRSAETMQAMSATMKRLSALARAASEKGGRSSLRYLLVVLAGFVVDLSIAWVAHEIFGLFLEAAAALGFLVAMTLSYFAHEFYTFQRSGSAVSPMRFGKFVAASGATLATRLALVWVSGFLTLLPGGSLARLLFAYGGSLVVGFLVNRGVVFTDSETGEASKTESR